MTASSFTKVRGKSPELDRVQDNIGNVLTPVAKAVNDTPIGGASPPPWIPIAVAAGWQNLGGGNAIPAYHKDALGYVHIKGAILNVSGGPFAGLLFTLPAGYRPAETNDFAMSVSGGPAQAVVITPTGTVTPDTNVANNGHCNVSITFLAEK